MKLVRKQLITKIKRMGKMKIKLGGFILFCFCLSGLQAQVSVNAGGSVASGSGGTVGYSVGQVVYTSNAGSNGSVTQGVQQPYGISITTGIDYKTIDLLYEAYPNPTSDNLTLKISDNDTENYRYQLFDINGKLLETKNILANVTYISMLSLTKGNYLLKITAKQSGVTQELKSFKIIKK